MVQPSAPSRTSMVAPRRPLPMKALSPHPVGSRSQTRSWRERKVGQSTRAVGRDCASTTGHPRVSETAVTQRRAVIELLQRIERTAPAYALFDVAIQVDVSLWNPEEVVVQLPVDGGQPVERVDLRLEVVLIGRVEMYRVPRQLELGSGHRYRGLQREPARAVELWLEPHIPPQIPVALRLEGKLDPAFQHDRRLHLVSGQRCIQPIQAVGSRIDPGAGPEQLELVVRLLDVADGVRRLGEIQEDLRVADLDPLRGCVAC